MTAALTTSPPRWTLSHGAALDCRFWGAECLVHHALSNNTHRLSDWAGQLLLDLGDFPGSPSSVLAERLELDVGTVDRALESLSELDLVVRC